MFKKVFAVFWLLAVASAPLAASDDHEASIEGLTIGMSAQQVLDVLQRPGDSDKEEKGELIIYWKRPNGDVLQVNFWKDHVSHLGLKYHAARPAAELGLVPQIDQRSALDSRDPNARFDYKETEISDKTRLVWTRQEETDQGYSVEVQFLSGSRKQFGDQMRQYVDFKYVTVPKSQRKKFEKSVQGG